MYRTKNTQIARMIEDLCNQWKFQIHPAWHLSKPCCPYSLLWVAQVFLDQHHLTYCQNLTAVKRPAMLRQFFIEVLAPFYFTCQSAHRILRVALREIHLRQYAASIACSIFHTHNCYTVPQFVALSFERCAKDKPIV